MEVNSSSRKSSSLYDAVEWPRFIKIDVIRKPDGHQVNLYDS